MNLEALTVVELLRRYGAVMDELRRRDIVRSANIPISDLAEILCCRAFTWTRAGNSASGHDAVDASNRRYQLKARRMGTSRGTRQLSAILNLDQNPFEVPDGISRFHGSSRRIDSHRGRQVAVNMVEAYQ